MPGIGTSGGGFLSEAPHDSGDSPCKGPYQETPIYTFRVTRNNNLTTDVKATNFSFLDQSVTFYGPDSRPVAAFSNVLSVVRQ